MGTVQPVWGWAKLQNINSGKWYYTWITKGARGGFYVHSNYGFYKSNVPVDGHKFWEDKYGDWNSDPLESIDDARSAMSTIITKKYSRGYTLLDKS